MDYFKLAVELTRAEAAPTLAKLAQKHMAIKRIAKTWDFTTTIEVTGADGTDHEIEVGISYDATYTAGKFSGPWEDSYPADSSMDITDVVPLEPLPEGVTLKQLLEPGDRIKERIEDETWDHYNSRGEND